MNKGIPMGYLVWCEPVMSLKLTQVVQLNGDDGLIGFFPEKANKGTTYRAPIVAIWRPKGFKTVYNNINLNQV